MRKDVLGERGLEETDRQTERVVSRPTGSTSSEGRQRTYSSRGGLSRSLRSLESVTGRVGALPGPHLSVASRVLWEEGGPLYVWGATLLQGVVRDLFWVSRVNVILKSIHYLVTNHIYIECITHPVWI